MKKILLALTVIITFLANSVYADLILVAHIKSNPIGKVDANTIYFDYDRIRHYEPRAKRIAILDVISWEAHEHGASYIYALCFNIKGSELMKIMDMDMGNEPKDVTDDIIRSLEALKTDPGFNYSDPIAYETIVYQTWDRSFMNAPKTNQVHHDRAE